VISQQTKKQNLTLRKQNLEVPSAKDEIDKCYDQLMAKIANIQKKYDVGNKGRIA
jgi:hypothetical protein